MIGELIRTLEKITVDRTSIGIEGVPFSGKTFYINKNYNCNKFYNLSEHMLFQNTVPSFVTSPWPSYPDAMIFRQAYFLNLEQERWNFAKNISQIKIFDRTVLSIIGYLYARTLLLSSSKEVWLSVLGILAEAIKQKKIKIPAQIIWLDTDYSIILKRAKDNERGCEDFLLKKSTYDILHEFYRETLSLLHDNKLISLKIIKSE